MRLDPPRRLGEFVLPDGRQLAWAEWGPAGGVPVLFSPGAGTGRRLGFGAGLLEELGVRLVSVDRPGLGVSTPLPGRTFGDFATDIGRLCDWLGLGAPAIVGHSQGAPFALACVAAGVAGPLALVSAVDEVAAFRDVLPDDQAALVDWIALDPVGAEAFFAGFTAESLYEFVLASSSSADLELFTDPAFGVAYKSALDEGFQQREGGYARDTALAMGPWPFDLRRIRTGVDVWYGELDTSHSPDQGVTLTRRIRGARRHVVPKVGAALLWTHPEPVLRTLLAHV